MNQVTWIGGWGMPPEIVSPLATEHWPNARHQFLPPDVASVQSATGADIVVGWSLGACRIIDAAVTGTRFRGQVILLAPFLAFGAEYGLGGKCALSQVKWLQRWLQRDPAAALADFRARAGLPSVATESPYSQDELLAGLDRLAADALPETGARLGSGFPAGLIAVIGDTDPLLDAERVALSLPGCTIAKGAGHWAGDLIKFALESQYAL